MVTFFPELDEIEKLRVKPTAGENYLLKFLSEYLGNLNGEFEVYFQPPWDGSFPDFVIMRKNHGILIIEVKDWNLDLYSLKDNDTWTYEGHEKQSPIAQARNYKDLFYNTYSRTLAVESLRNTKNFALVPAAVFFYGSTENRVRNFFGSHLDKDSYLSSKHIILLTPDILTKNGLNTIPYANFFIGKPESRFFNDDIYNELHRVLKPSEHSRLKNVSMMLSNVQRDIATSKPSTKQKIKGPAGSGKTTVLAYRAVDAFKKTGKPVLILTFNITLCNYIRDCISAALESLPEIKGVKKATLQTFFKIMHYHLFYGIYRNKTDQQKKMRPDKKKHKYVESYGRLEKTPIKYSTILVDETQDYEREWLETIVNDFLEKDGEIVFFGDEDQNVYEREEMTEPAKIPKVPGRWRELKGTYRLSSRIAELARDFQVKFFEGSVGNEISPQGNLFDETTVRYFFFNEFNRQAIVNICKRILSQNSNDDICVLSHIVKHVRPIEKDLRSAGYPTKTTFETEEEYNEFVSKYENDELEEKLYPIRRAAKFAFNMESGKIKLSTIQSYKGWGIPTEILIIGNDNEDVDGFLNYAMIYTGITRAIQNLIIINIRDKDMDKFFSEWMNSHRIKIGVI